MPYEIARRPHPPTAGFVRRRRSLLRGALLALLSLVLVGPAAARAAVLPADATVALDGTPDLLSLLPTPVNNSTSTRQAVSADGRLVVFSSSADGLMAGDDDNVENVYVEDVATGALRLVSRASGEQGEPAHVDCTGGAISADGHAVAFACFGALDGSRENGFERVYARNLDTQQTTLVSRSTDGDPAEGAAPAVAHVGSGDVFVAFTSTSQDLVSPPLSTGAERVFRRRVGGTDATLLVGDGTNPSIDDDGGRIVFETGQALDAADTNNAADVYVRDFAPATPTTTLVSRADVAASVPGAVGNSDSIDAVISGDGSAVAFASFATNLEATGVRLDADTVQDVYLRSLAGGTTKLLSVAAGHKGEADSVPTGIDRSGRVVALRSASRAFDAAHVSPNADFYVSRDPGDGRRTLSLVSGGGGAASSRSELVAAVSDDGATVAMWIGSGVTQGLPADADPAFDRVVLRDLGSGAMRTVSRPPGDAPFANQGGDAGAGGVSADGRFVAFASAAPGLGAPGDGAILVRDLETGAVTIASRADGAAGAPLAGISGVPAISGDGRRVAFAVDPDGTGNRQIYVRDLPSGRTFVASRADGPDGAVGAGFSVRPSLSDDGTRVAFLSAARGLTADALDGQDHVFVRDLATGRTLLVDRADGDGRPANRPAEGLAISGDGRSVAFATDAPLADGDTGADRDVYVRTLEDARTRLASVAGHVHGASTANPSISRDGSRVAFLSSADFGSGAIGDALYVKDIADGAMTLASRADGAGGAPVARATAERISADGQHVAFEAAPSAVIAPGAPADAVTRVFERDLASGATRLISRRTGVAGAALDVDGFVAIGGITADGGCVVFQTNGPLLPAQTSTDFAHVYLRTVTPNCGRPIPLSSGGGGGGSKPAVLSRLAVKPARFHVGGRHGGTRIAFRVDKVSTVSLRFQRLLAGHRAKGRGAHCSTRLRRGKRCTLVKRVGRALTVHGQAGANTVRFSGRVGRRALVPGRYRLTATPAGGRGRSVAFVVVRAPRTRRHAAKGRTHR